jgi:adenylate cyclase class 2
MPREIEIKLRVAEHQTLRGALERAGAEARGVVHETNIFFDHADGSLRAADSALRVRLARPWDGGASTALLTWKGPRDADALRTREAFDVMCEPAEQIVPLVEKLGLRETLRFEKRRETWALSGCLIELDFLPAIGSFVEIEGPSEAEVVAVQGVIGLARAPVEERGYSRLVSSDLAGAGGGGGVRF